MKAELNQRIRLFLLTLGTVVVLGGAFALMSSTQPPSVSSIDSATTQGGSERDQTAAGQHAQEARRSEIELRFQQAVAMLHAREYDYAVKALHRVLELSPRLVDAHVNMGYALLGLGEYKAAYDFFQGATTLRPGQINAYYGMAITLEAMSDLHGAVGAMRTYIHLSPPDDPYQARARAALWEWQERLARQPASSTRGGMERP